MSKQGRIERRYVPLMGFELRATGGAKEMVGYASVFNTETVIAGLWREMVAPGAYSKTIAEQDIRALWNHDANIVLGRNKAGTLKLSEDGKGLHSVIMPPDNEWGRPVMDAVKRGDVTGMSISFRPIRQEWYWPDRSSQELPKRTILEARLFDVSPVTYPAFEATEISARSAGIETVSLGEVEVDILEQARRLVRCAQRGLVLTREDRDLVATAVEILRSGMPAAEPEVEGTGVPHDAHHSAEGRDGEPEAEGTSVPRNAHHSFEWRDRHLELLAATLG